MENYLFISYHITNSYDIEFFNQFKENLLTDDEFRNLYGLSREYEIIIFDLNKKVRVR